MRKRMNVNVLGAMFLVLLLVRAAPESPVADAAMKGDIESVRSLLRSGADVNAAQGDGMTALHWAAVRNDVAMAEEATMGSDDGADSSAGGTATSAPAAAGFSGTNNQEAGVDEPDFVKTDGSRILTITNAPRVALPVGRRRQ